MTDFAQYTDAQLLNDPAHRCQSYRFTVGHSGPFLLGGNSITHNRDFLARHAPQTFSRLHYRPIDVSGIEQEMVRDGYDRQIAAWRERFESSEAHRALGDIRDSIRQLDALRSMRSVRALGR